MSYNDRIEAALAAIKEHNEAVGGEGKLGFLNSDDFIACVKASGGTSDERLSALSHEDLLACMPASPNGVKPRVLAKEIADIFRNKSKVANDESQVISSKKADKMTIRELVESFDPEDYTNPVAVRLATISKGEKFVVYSDGKLVDVETTLKLLLEIKGGFSGRNDVDVNGSIKKTYKVGEPPETYADENPLYRNRPLRPDGTCDQTGRSWEGIDLTVRQFIRVAMEVGELQITHEIAHNTLDIVMETDALKKLRSRYRKSAIKFDELVSTNDLPKLTIMLGGVRGDNPFAGGKQVHWQASSGHSMLTGPR